MQVYARRSRGNLSSVHSMSVRRKLRILALMQDAREAGAIFVPISEIGNYVSSKEPAVFLKHDVHNVSASKLIEFAHTEAEAGIFGTYFFLQFCHPRTNNYFSVEEQKVMMKEVKALGHEIGMHYDLLHDLMERDLAVRWGFQEQLKRFSDIVGPVTVGNCHGNTKYKFKDIHGNIVLYEFIEELARHTDYPELKLVDKNIAEIIRRERVSLKELGMANWGESWIWASEYGLVATNLVTDNWVGKKNVLVVIGNTRGPNAYGLNPSRTTTIPDGTVDAEWVHLVNSVSSRFKFRNVQMQMDLFSTEIRRLFLEGIPHSPFVMLVHPEFYAQ